MNSKKTNTLLWMSVVPNAVFSCVLLYLIFVVLPTFFLDQTISSYKIDIQVFDVLYYILIGLSFTFIAYTFAPNYKTKIGILFSVIFIFFILYGYSYLEEAGLVKRAGAFNKGVLLYGSLSSLFILIFPSISKYLDKDILKESIESNKNFMNKIAKFNEREEPKSGMSRSERLRLQAFKNVQDKKNPELMPSMKAGLKLKILRRAKENPELEKELLNRMEEFKKKED